MNGKNLPDDDLETTRLDMPSEDELQGERKKSLPPPGASKDHEEAMSFLRENLSPEKFAALRIAHPEKLTMEDARIIVGQLMSGKARAD